MKVTFYPRGAMIQARISDGARVNFRLSTGIKVPEYLKFSKGKFIGKTAEANSLNVELDRQRVELQDLYLRFGKLEPIKSAYNNKLVHVEEDFDENSFDIINLLREYIRLSVVGKIVSKSRKRLTDGTIGTYGNAVNALAEYCSSTNSINLSDYSIAPNMNPLQRRKIKDDYQSFFNGFDKYLSRLGLKFNTRSLYMNYLSVMINYWNQELCLNLPKFTFQSPKLNPIVVLDSEFISDFISDKDSFYETLDEKMKYTWEVCTTILFTTLRIQDALDLEWKDFQVVKDKMYMLKFNKKTGVSQAPLPQKLSNIYRMNMAKFGRIYTMPPSRKTVVNHINRLFGLYKPMHEFVNIRKFGVMGEEICETMKFHEAVYPHMLRKSAITNMLLNGLDERTIKNLSGHADRSASFERYVGFSQSHFNNKLEDYYSKVTQ